MKTQLSTEGEWRVLVAAGHTELVARAAYLLAREGCRLETAFTGLDALEVLQHCHFNLLIIGSAFPDLGALEVLRRALVIPGVNAALGRPHASAVATLMLLESDSELGTSASGSADREAARRIAALAGGADDALTLPCHDEELRLRATALLRHRERPEQRPEGDFMTLGPIRVDTAAVQVTIDGDRTPLTRAEFRILCALIRGPGVWLTEAELASAVWGGQAPSSRALVVHVSRLRGKIATSGIDIDSVAGAYRLLHKPAADAARGARLYAGRSRSPRNRAVGDALE